MSEPITITIGADGTPDPIDRRVRSGEKVRWVSVADDWVVRFAPKRFLEVNHWPFSGGQRDILVSHATGSLEYVAEKNWLRKEHHYMTGRRLSDGKNETMGNGAKIIVR